MRRAEDVSAEAVTHDEDTDQHGYAHHIRAFLALLGRSPNLATAKEARRFQLDQCENGVRE